MKLNHSKKPIKKFNPIKHWYTILLSFFVLCCIVILYSVYSFYYIKKEISIINTESKNSIQNSTTTESIEKSQNDTQLLRDINNLNKTLEEFEKREIEYNRLIKSAIPAPVIATTTASTTVATSTE